MLAAGTQTYAYLRPRAWLPGCRVLTAAVGQGDTSNLSLRTGTKTPLSIPTSFFPSSLPSFPPSVPPHLLVSVPSLSFQPFLPSSLQAPVLLNYFCPSRCQPVTLNRHPSIHPFLSLYLYPSLPASRTNYLPLSITPSTSPPTLLSLPPSLPPPPTHPPSARLAKVRQGAEMGLAPPARPGPCAMRMRESPPRRRLVPTA